MTIRLASILFMVFFLCCIHASAQPQNLYPGITEQQNRIALVSLEYVNNLAWEDAEKQMLAMADLEDSENLPPLSYLLRVSMRVFQLQNDEVENSAESAKLTKEIQELGKTGLFRAKAKNFPDSVRPTLLFISGGIKGFTATLSVETDPFGALNQGLDAVKNLNTARSLYPAMADAYFGSGLFNCLLAKYPQVWQFMINMFKSQNISLDTGLTHLRICANQATYTSAVAKQYLVRFLSPYNVALANEKRELFRWLAKKYPANSYFLFCELDESLCFYPDSLMDPTYQSQIKKRLLHVSKNNFSQKRYANLAQWQYSFIDPSPPPLLAPDSIPNYDPFCFYPIFIEGVKIKFTLLNAQNIPKKLGKLYVSQLAVTKERSIKLLNTSTMYSLRKPTYLWHIKDGLMLKK